MNNYHTLLNKVDHFVAEIRARHPESFVCAPGCAECCVAGITVWRIEFESVRLASRDARLTKAPPSRCPLLDSDGRCTIYDARPIVCRLWGAPLLFPSDIDRNDNTSLHHANETRLDSDDATLTCCRLNFTEPPTLAQLLPSDLINVETVLTTLAAINHVYCRKKGFDPNERLALNALDAAPFPS